VEDGETEFGPVEVSKQIELSYRHGFGRGLQFRVDAYYRRLTDLRPRYENLFEPIELFPETTEDRVKIAPDEALLEGVELLLRGDLDRSFFWWVSYTRSSAKDRLEDRWEPRSWDQPDAARFLIGYRCDDRWSLSLSGSAHTGWPTTPIRVDPVTEEPYWDLAERNTDRYPDHIRFDLKARRSFSLPRGRLWLTLEVVNLTSRRNACCLNDVEVVTQPDGTLVAVPEFDYWLGFTPSFSVLWRF
jgi:hypothetical protein